MDPTHDPASQSTKPGWQTSEVYVGIASALAVVLGKLTDVQSVVVGVVAVAYIIARSYSKSVVAKGAADVAAGKEGGKQ
jgi:hypothetical protein